MTSPSFVAPRYVDHLRALADAVTREAYSRLRVDIVGMRMSADDNVSGVVTWTAMIREGGGTHSFECIMPQQEFFFNAVLSVCIDRFLCRTLQFMGKL